MVAVAKGKNRRSQLSPPHTTIAIAMIAVTASGLPHKSSSGSVRYAFHSRYAINASTQIQSARPIRPNSARIPSSFWCEE